MSSDDNTAKNIYQEILDTMSLAIMDEDVDAVLKHFSLPHLMRTKTTEIIVETKEEMSEGVVALSRALKGLGTTNYVRLATDARFLSEDYIEGHHVAHILKDAVPVVESYANRMVLKKHEGRWRVQEVESNINCNSWPIYMLNVQRQNDELSAPKSPVDDARCLSVSPLSIYQDFLDSLTHTNNENDLEGYCSHLLFPYTSHTERDDTIFRSIDDVRPFVDYVWKQLIAKEGNLLMRSAERAEFLSYNLICGYHETTIRSGKSMSFGPVKSRMLLKREDTAWYLKSVTNSLTNSRYPYNVPKPHTALVTLQTIKERTRE